MPAILEQDRDVGLQPESDADVGLSHLERDADVGLVTPDTVRQPSFPHRDPFSVSATAGGPQRFTNWKDLAAEVHNEPAPDVSGAIVKPFLAHSETEPDESLVGISPEKVPEGNNAVTIAASSVGKAAAGLGQFLTSPKGIAETVAAATPARLLVMAKWFSDMAAGAGQSAGDLSVLLQKPNKNKDDWRRISDETVNTGVMLLGAGALGSDVGTEMTGVRAPLSRMVESKKTRLSKDLAGQLDQAASDSDFGAKLSRASELAQPLERDEDVGLSNSATSESARSADATPARPADLSADSLADLQATLNSNQVKPRNKVHAAQLEMLRQAAEEKAAEESQGNVGQGNKASKAIDATPLTKLPEGETTALGAADQTVTGQNEERASDATAATTLAAEQMPAEGFKTPSAAPTSKPIKFITSPLTDADGLAHDIVSNHGKIPIFIPRAIDAANWRRLNNKLKGGGILRGTERDQYARIKALFPENHEDDYGADGGAAARAAYDAAKRAGFAHELFQPVQDGSNLRLTQLMDFVRQTQGEDFQPGDLWHKIESIANEHAGRELQANQLREFEAKVIANRRPKAEQNKVDKFRSPDLRPGDSFTVQNHTFEVTGFERDEQGTPILRVKDGPKFGEQQVIGNETLHVDKGSFEPGGEHAESVPRPVKPPIPDNKELGGNTTGKPLELGGENFELHDASESKNKIEQRGAEALDEIAQDLYGKPYDEVTEEEQGKVRVTLDHEDREWMSQYEQPGPRPRRSQAASAQPPLERASSELQRPATEAGTEKQSPKLTQRDRDTLAQEIYRKNYDDLFPESQAHVQEELDNGRRAGQVLAHPVEIRLRGLMDERAKLVDAMPWLGSDRHQSPDGPIAVGHLGRIKYIDGQIDMLREIARADPKLKSAFIEKFLEGDTAKDQHQTIDKIVDWLESLKMDLGGGQMHAFGLIPKTWNDLIDLVMAGIRTGRKLADAIDFGISRIKGAHAVDLSNFDEAGARNYFETTQPGNLRYESTEAGPETLDTLKQRQQEITDRLTEIGKDADRLRRTNQGLPDDLRGERFKLAKESRDIERKLLASPEHVADLLKRLDAKMKSARAAEKTGDEAAARQARAEMRDSPEASDIERVDSKLLERVRRQLEAAKEIEPLDERSLPAGRTLGELTNWLRKNKLDSPGIPMRDRFNLWRRLTEEWNRGKDNYAKTMAKVSGMWDAFKAQYKAPPVDGNFRSLMKDWFFEKQWTGLETHKWVEEIRRQVPQKIRRQGISVWLDAGGDANVLRAQRDEVPARFRPIWDAALQLTAKEKAAGRQISLDFERKLGDAMNLGLIEKGRENYGVPQLWEIAPKHDGEFDPFKKKETARKPTAKLDPRSPFFALHRTVPSYFDGIMAGGVPKDLDIGGLVGIYNFDLHNSLADRGVIKAMKDAKAEDGSPLVMIAGGVHVEPGEGGGRAYFADSNRRPKDAVTADGRPYQTLDHWALKDWKFSSQDGNGNPILLRGDFMVHPDAYKFLKNELGVSWLRDPEGGGKFLNPLSNSTAFLKASKFASATFHMATLAEHSLFHAFAGKPSTERLSLLWPSTRGVELDPAKNPELSGLMRGGLELGFGNSRELFEEGLSSHGGIFRIVPGLGDAMTKQSDFLFKRYMPALKVKTADVMLKVNRERYAGKLSDEQIYELTANQANAAFGAQNWKLLGTNKTWLDVNRLFLTAPDFLLSRAKVVGQAFKPYNREQTLFLLSQAAIVYTAARVLNQLLDDDAHFEPENAFRVVYKGRSYGARFLVSDIQNLLMSPVEFASGRIGPFGRSGIEALTGRDMRTGARKEVPFETDNKALRSAQIFLKDSAEWLIPVGVEGMLPGAAGREQTGPGNVALALGGVSSRKYTAQTEMWKLATDFNRHGDAAAKLYQKQRDDDAHGESDFRKLDNLLDAGDFARAKREYIELVKEGHTPKNIKARFRVITIGRDQVPHASHTFTGSVEREKQFRQSLTPAQLKVYDQALAERKDRAEKFVEMLSAAPTPAGESLPDNSDPENTPAP